MNERQKKLYGKLNSAINSQNYNAVISILVGEIKPLLVTDRQKLIDAIRGAGGKVSDSISDADLAMKISAGLINNYQPFIDLLVKLIFKENSYSNAGGKAEGAVGEVMEAAQDPIKASSKAIGALGNVISKSIYGKGTKKAQAEAEKIAKKRKALEIANELLQKKEEEKTQAMIAESELQLEESKKKSKKKIMLIAGCGVLLAISVLAIYGITQKKS